MMTRRSSVSNALATFEANIAKSGETQSRSFLTNVASALSPKGKKKKKAAMGLNRPSVPTLSPPASPARSTTSTNQHQRQRKPQSQKIQSTVEKFEKTGSANSDATSTKRGDTHNKTQYEYDYTQTKQIWKERTKKRKTRLVNPFKHANVQAWIPTKLRERRKQVRQESIAQRMPRRSSMGLVGTLSQEFKPEDLYPELFTVNKNSNNPKKESSTTTTRTTAASPPATRRGSMRSYNSASSTQDTRRKHRRGGKRRNRKQKELPNTKRRKAKRRNSTGRVRLAEEPVVNIYWNPAGLDDPENDDLAQSTWRYDDSAQFTEDYERATDANLDKKQSNKDETTLETLHRKGVVQRRKSTGYTRFAQEPTHWLYSREDEEIQNATIPDKRQKETQRAQKKHKGHKARGKSKKEHKRQSNELETQEKPTAKTDEKEHQEQDNEDDQDRQQPVTVMLQTIPVHEEPSNAPLRSVHRRLSTGNVPMDKEADSRLHRKQKIKREQKRRFGGMLRREQQSLFSPNSPDKPRKASIMGLLDPMAALADDPENPKSYLAGDEDCFFTFAPLRTPKRRSTSPSRPDFSMRPGGITYDSEEASDIENSGHSYTKEEPNEVSTGHHDNDPAAAYLATRTKTVPESLPTLESEDEESEQIPSEDDAKAATFVEPKATAQIESSSDSESSVSLPGAKDTAKKLGAKVVPSKEAKPSVLNKGPLDEPNISTGFSFSIVQAGWQVKRFMDSNEDVVKEEVIKQALPESQSLRRTAASQVRPKKKTVALPIDDDDSDSSISSYSSSSCSPSSSESTIGDSMISDEDAYAPQTAVTESQAASSPRGPIVRVPTGPSPIRPLSAEAAELQEVPALEDCGEDSDDGDGDCSSSSDNTFPNVLRPGVTRSLSFENDREMMKSLKEMQGLRGSEGSPTGADDVDRAAPQRQPSVEMDREILQAVDKAGVSDDDEATFVELKKVCGHPAAHMIKSVAKLEREEKKEKKKKREKKLRKKKSKDPSNNEDHPGEERKKRRKSKSKEKSKEDPEKFPRKEKDVKKEKKSKREKSEKLLKKAQSEKRLKKDSDKLLKKAQSEKRLKKEGTERHEKDPGQT